MAGDMRSDPDVVWRADLRGVSDIAPSRARFLEAISMTTASNAQLLLGFMG